MLNMIKSYFRAKRFKKALITNCEDLHNISKAYAWLREYKSLKDDTECFKRVSYNVPSGYIETNYKNFADLMDAVNEVSLFYRFGKKILHKPLHLEEYSFTRFMVNNFDYIIKEEQVVDYIKTYINYFVDDLFNYSVDEESTIVAHSRILIINVAVLLKATLVIK